MSRRQWRDGKRKSVEATEEMEREFKTMWEQKRSLKKILAAQNIVVDKCGGCSQYFTPLAYEFFCESCKNRHLVDKEKH